MHELGLEPQHPKEEEEGGEGRGSDTGGECLQCLNGPKFESQHLHRKCTQTHKIKLIIALKRNVCLALISLEQCCGLFPSE